MEGGCQVSCAEESKRVQDTRPADLVPISPLQRLASMKNLDVIAAELPRIGVSLGVQVGAGLGLLILIFGIHGAGVVGVTKLLRLEPSKLRAHRVDFEAFGLMLAVGLCLFALHLLEIFVFAFFYLFVGAIEGFEDALFISISAFTTLGSPDGNFPRDWRIVAALEGLVGFLLIGWSTAIFVTDMNRLLRERPSSTMDR